MYLFTPTRTDIICYHRPPAIITSTCTLTHLFTTTDTNIICYHRPPATITSTCTLTHLFTPTRTDIIYYHRPPATITSTCTLTHLFTTPPHWYYMLPPAACNHHIYLYINSPAYNPPALILCSNGIFSGIILPTWGQSPQYGEDEWSRFTEETLTTAMSKQWKELNSSIHCISTCLGPTIHNGSDVTLFQTTLHWSNNS